MKSSSPSPPGSRHSSCSALIFRARYEFRNWCGRSPGLFTAIHGRKRFNRTHAVRPTTDLCIEGFPRSANSYAVLRLAACQKRRVSISHHLHVPAQVRRAVLWNIPTLVLIRHPRDVATSLLIRHSELSAGQILRAYIGFYRTVLPLRDGFVLGDFAEVTQNLGGVVDRINDRFGTVFVPPQSETIIDDKVFRMLDEINQSQGRTQGEHAVSRPSPERSAKKQAILQRLLDGPHVHVLNRAEAIYAQMLSECNREYAEPITAAPPVAA